MPALPAPSPARKAARRTLRRYRRAFTLIEAVTSIVIFGFLLSVAATLIFTGARTYLDAADSSRLTAEMSIALERIAHEIRNIPAVSGASGAAVAIDEIDASSIKWQAAGAPSDGALALSGSSILLTTTDAHSIVLLTGVSALSFRAFDSSGAIIALPLSGSAVEPVQRIEISLTAARGASGAQTLRTLVFPRNLVSGVQP